MTTAGTRPLARSSPRHKDTLVRQMPCSMTARLSTALTVDHGPPGEVPPKPRSKQAVPGEGKTDHGVEHALQLNATEPIPPHP